MQAADGKMRMTDKAEPFKQWMARVASERLDQMQDPELSIEQASWTINDWGIQAEENEGQQGKIKTTKPIFEFCRSCKEVCYKIYSFTTFPTVKPLLV